MNKVIMNTPNETPLDSELLRLKSALAAETAPDFIAARLQAALQPSRPVADAPPQRPAAGPRAPRFWFLPPAAALTLSAWFAWVGFMAPAALAPTAATSEGGAFIALKPLETIALYEAESRIVSTEVPRVWLASAGVPVAPERAAEPIQIDLLVGSRGEALAFRVPNL